MCNRHVLSPLPILDATNFNRRNFLKAAVGLTTLTVAMSCGFHGQALAANATIKGTHGTGFCNLNFFLAHALQTAKNEGVIIDFVNTPTGAEDVTFLSAGHVDVALIPYTSFISLWDSGAPIKIVAGGGIEGCMIISQPGLDTAEKLKGKTLATFQLDTLEILPYDWLKKHGISFKDINVRYMLSSAEAVEAFRAGAVDWICTIEPYATLLLNEVKGAHKLSDGTDIYGKGYTDCVLAARSDLLKESPVAVKALIKSMMQAQLMAETDPNGALSKVIGTYYKTSHEHAALAMAKQQAVVDARSQTQFILDRTDSLMEMGYIKNKPGRDAIDWSLLEQVIAENQDIYSKLKYKST